MGYPDIIRLIRSSSMIERAVKNAQRMHKKTLSMVESSWRAIYEDDGALARKVIAADDEVDELYIEIRKDVLTYLSSMPLGGNIEFSLILLDIATYLERIADHAVWNCETALDFPRPQEDKYKAKLQRQRDLVVGMIKGLKTAFGTTDVGKAKEVVRKNKELKKNYSELVAEISKNKIPAGEAICIWCVSRNLLRMGGYSENIAKTVLLPYPQVK